MALSKTKGGPRLTASLYVALLLVFLAGCGKPPAPKEGTKALKRRKAVHLVGAGSSFVAPLLEKMLEEYGKLRPEVRIEYQSIGSGGGIKQIIAKTVDFGVSDAPMSEAELKEAPGELLHLPITLGSVALAYHLTGGPRTLKMTGKLIAAIFEGRVKNWSDPEIQRLNPGVSLPDLPIAVVRRADSSGTTFVFTSYLATLSSRWEATKTPDWPVGLGAKGNEGVTAQILQTEGALGYVELAYALENDLPLVAIQNREGNFMLPSLEGTTRAAASVEQENLHDFRISLVNPPGEKAYPIVAFTYLLVYRNMADPVKAKALVDFIRWAIRDGQKLGEKLHYARLPSELVKKIDEALKTIQAQGEPVS